MSKTFKSVEKSGVKLIVGSNKSEANGTDSKESGSNSVNVKNLKNSN